MKKFGTFFLPGPTEVRPEILQAMLAPMLPHRGAEFESLFSETVSLLKPIFRTSRPVYVSSSSATGLMEMSVRCARPGKILSLVNGAFSERYADIARACARDVTVLEAPWGSIVSLDAVEAALTRAHFAALTVVHSETSTGALTPLEPLARLAHRFDTMILVDSVTGLGGARVESDDWELDVLLTGSQKALALPPGLAFAVVSERFLQGAAHAPARGRYFDVLEFEQYARKNQTPNTPALSLIYATLAQTRTISGEGMEARWERHALMASATYAWVERMTNSGISLSVLADASTRSPTVTAIVLPSSVTAESIVGEVAKRGFVIGAGYGKLRSNCIRIGHMGDHTVEGVARCLDVVEGALAHALGRPTLAS